MGLVEYLYVDVMRLDSYFEQISPPITYDKVPMWNAEVSLTGPKAGGAQQRFARPYSVHEKIAKLTKHLEDEGLVGYGRASRQDSEGYFRIETCRARRVFIPPDHGQPPEVGGLNIWISAVSRTEEEIRSILDLERRGYMGRDEVGNLYLLEDVRRSDELGYDYMSSYSVLSLMLGGYPRPGFGNEGGDRRFFDSDVLDAVGPDPDFLDKVNPKVATAMRQEAASNWKETRQPWGFFTYFLIDPTRALAQIGAQIGPERSIRTLYRVRVLFPEEELFKFGHRGLATFGYPIFIAEDTDPV